MRLQNMHFVGTQVCLLMGSQVQILVFSGGRLYFGQLGLHLFVAFSGPVQVLGDRPGELLLHFELNELVNLFSGLWV